VVTNTGTAQLPVPEVSDIANVPAHMTALADAVGTKLDAKLDKAGVPTTIQKKIIVQPGTGTPTGTFAEGDIVFMNPPGS
jgi:hypothetical protein